jgi:hypothetical protein
MMHCCHSSLPLVSFLFLLLPPFSFVLALSNVVLTATTSSNDVWGSITRIALEDIIDDDDRQLQKKTQIIPTLRVLASIPKRRRVQGGNTDADDDDDDENDNNDDKNNDDNNDDSNNNNNNNDSNNNNDNDTPSPTVLDIKEPCTICNNDSLGINTNVILPTNDGMTCNDLVQLALQIESNSNECNTIQLSEGICCLTPVPS